MDTAVKTLTTVPTTVSLRPQFEGNNISYAIGFKHINYLAETAVLAHFREAGLSVGDLYRKHALGFDVVELGSRLGALLDVDDEATVTVTPVSDAELKFKVTMTVQRDGVATKAATSTVRVVLRRDNHVTAVEPLPDGLERFVVDRLGAAEPRPVTGDPLAALTEGRNAFGWKYRIPYFYCHFNERMQMSAFLRVMEEVVDLFLADRGLPIKATLDERNWIPVVTQSTISLLDEAIMEEDLYTVYTVEDIFKGLLYTSRMDCHVLRDGALVQVATGRITHGYLTERAQNDWVMASFDDSALAALSGANR